ncbi:MAG: hypothetical protein ACLTG0_13720 [Oscillibacter sp.]
MRGGADCLGVGAMFSTSTKTDVDVLPRGDSSRPSVTRSIFRSWPSARLNTRAAHPRAFRARAFDGVALVSAIFSAEDIESECRELRALSEKMVNA